MDTTNKRNSKTIVRRGRDNIKKKLYAIAVEKYFSTVTDKDNRFRKYSALEEREAIERLRNDRQSLENELTEHNIFFAINYASQQAYRFSDYDELISLAMNGLRMAATTFDIDSGWRFNTWASFYIKNFVLKRFYSRREMEIDKNTSIYLDSNQETTSGKSNSEFMYNTINSKIDVSQEYRVENGVIKDVEDNERREIIKKCANSIIRYVGTSTLSSFDKRVFNNLFIKGYTIALTSKELGVSRNRISSSRDRIKTYIKTNFDRKSISDALELNN